MLDIHPPFLQKLTPIRNLLLKKKIIRICDHKGLDILISMFFFVVVVVIYLNICLPKRIQTPKKRKRKFRKHTTNSRSWHQESLVAVGYLVGFHFKN